MIAEIDNEVLKVMAENPDRENEAIQHCATGDVEAPDRARCGEVMEIFKAVSALTPAHVDAVIELVVAWAGAPSDRQRFLDNIRAVLVTVHDREAGGSFSERLSAFVEHSNARFHGQLDH